jgi:hypothetical protein
MAGALQAMHLLQKRPFSGSGNIYVVAATCTGTNAHNIKAYIGSLAGAVLQQLMSI